MMEVNDVAVDVHQPAPRLGRGRDPMEARRRGLRCPPQRLSFSMRSKLVSLLQALYRTVGKDSLVLSECWRWQRWALNLSMHWLRLPATAPAAPQAGVSKELGTTMLYAGE